ncbi:MAG: TldD/PmbA family protein [Myxococcota bacterium]|jgi:PmbA protein|nr:TldD/PmbA family protein [Myxococcota bacterium]
MPERTPVFAAGGGALATRALELLLDAGANQGRVILRRERRVEVRTRQGRVEKLEQASRATLRLSLFVDGRFSQQETSDLRLEPLRQFIQEGVHATRLLTPDPHRLLPPLERCRPLPLDDLQLFDPAIPTLTPEVRRDRALQLEQLAREATGKSLRSASATWGDQISETVLVQSNGTGAQEKRTSCYALAEVSVDDPAGRRPEGWWYAETRHLDDLPSDREIALTAAQRGLAQIGARPAPTARTKVLVEAPAAGTLLNHLLRALDGVQVQQERSFLAGRLGQTVGSRSWSLGDRPLLPRSLGGRSFDGEGMVARPFPVLEEGVLRSFFLDTTYASKLGLTATTGGPSNLVLEPGRLSRAELLARLGDGLLITGFLGGNANVTTGDFSLGIVGQEVSRGRLAGPVASSNLSGNLATLLQNLAEVGNDTYRWSAIRRPSLLFTDLQVSGR